MRDRPLFRLRIATSRCAAWKSQRAGGSHRFPDPCRYIGCLAGLRSTLAIRYLSPRASLRIQPRSLRARDLEC